MAKVPGPPPLNGLKRRIAEHRAQKGGVRSGNFVRETYCLSRD